MNPSVSVVIPVYNAKRFVHETIASVLNQTYQDFELILVEDASTDGTREMLETNPSTPNIRIIYNDRNRGIAYSTNKGIALSKGKYIALLDDDDLAEPDRLSIQATFLEEHPEIDVLGGRTTWIDEAGEVIGYTDAPRNNPNYMKVILLFRCLDFMNGTCMMRKSFIEAHDLHYQDNCYGMQDFLFYIDCSKVGNIVGIDRFLLRHRAHGQNVTDKALLEQKENRAAKYAELQRYSLEKSGFVLSEEDFAFLHRTFPEFRQRKEEGYDLKRIREIFEQLLRQAKDMKVEYLPELQHFLRRLYAEKVIDSQNFFGD